VRRVPGNIAREPWTVAIMRGHCELPLKDKWKPGYLNEDARGRKARRKFKKQRHKAERKWNLRET
jgi:hypothetical protein